MKQSLWSPQEGRQHAYTYYKSRVPKKYFEYLRGGLKVMAVDFPAHRELPFNELITFFEENNIDDFEKSLKNLSFSKIMNSVDFNKISLQTRASRIINFVARLEGVEPPTL